MNPLLAPMSGRRCGPRNEPGTVMNDVIVFDRIDKDGPQTYRGTFDLSPAELIRDEVEGLGSVEIEARAEKGNLPGEYIVDGSARFTADLLCSRCVEPYPFANDSTFH